jgi:hypothetical protein
VTAHDRSRDRERGTVVAVPAADASFPLPEGQKMGKLSSLTAVFLTLAGLALPSSSAAEPLRITVTFSIVGSSAEPDFGAATGTGQFSFVTAQPPATDQLNPAGFGLESMSFNWAGVDWNTSNADIYRIGLEPDGRPFAFSIGGAPSGLDLSLAVPDFRLLFCVADIKTPTNDCSEFTFEYSTSRSTTLGTFTGFLSQMSVAREPLDEAPVPEPMTLLLVGSGLGVIGARRRFLQSLRSPAGCGGIGSAGSGQNTRDR